jgi:hypothetical protein
MQPPLHGENVQIGGAGGVFCKACHGRELTPVRQRRCNRRMAHYVQYILPQRIQLRREANTAEVVRKFTLTIASCKALPTD